MIKTFKQIIFVTFILLLVSPAIERGLGLFDLKPLDGAFVYETRKELTYDNWANTGFQKSFERDLKDRIGFKELFVRVNNQIGYSLFSVVRAKNVVLGKDNMLYQDYYIDGYFGRDYVGYEKLNKNIRGLRKVQKILKSKGVEMVFVIVPGKASIYPENFPGYLTSKKDTSNYDATVSLFKKYDCQYLDLKQFFLPLKEISEYPIFPRQGTHWSGYAVTLAADTLFKYLSASTDFYFDKFKSKKGDVTTIPRGTDNDIGRASNLLLLRDNEELYYPKISFEKDSSNAKPNVLIIGDSFTLSFWGFYPYFPELFNEDSRFWYYNKKILWPNEYKDIEVSTLDLQQEIVSRDIVMIVSSEHNLNNPGFGFINDVLNTFKDKEAMYSSKIKYYINKIKSDPVWLDSIKVQADNINIPLDSMIYTDAKWLCKEDFIRFYTDSIILSADWLKQVKVKARARQILIDSMIYFEASSIVNSDIDNIENKIFLRKTSIFKKIEQIKSDPKLLKLVEEKAGLNNISVEKQLELDAEWMLENQ